MTKFSTKLFSVFGILLGTVPMTCRKSPHGSRAAPPRGFP
jgi:hypothetical protein